MTGVYIIGAGGFGREVLQYIQDLRQADLHVRGFVDDAPTTSCCSLPVQRMEEVELLGDEEFIVAVGDPQVRSALVARAEPRGWRFFTLLHPRAYVAPTAELAPGCIVSPFAFVGPSARLGAHVVLNVHSTADHDSVIGDCSYLAPYALVGGAARLGAGVLVGPHASVAARAAVAAAKHVAAGDHVPTTR